MKKLIMFFVMMMYSLSFAQLDIQKMTSYLDKSPETFIKDYNLTQVKSEDNFGEIIAFYKGFVIEGNDYTPKIIHEGGKIKSLSFYNDKAGKSFFANASAELDKLPSTYKSFFTQRNYRSYNPSFSNDLQSFILKLKDTNLKYETGMAKFQTVNAEYVFMIIEGGSVLEIKKPLEKK